MRFILCAVIIYYCQHYTNAAFMKTNNKYISRLQSFKHCPGRASSLRNLKFERYNRSHKSLSYDFTYPRPLDENVGGSVSVERWGDGGWISVPFLGLQNNICQKMLGFFKPYFVMYNKLLKVAHPDRCPIPAGNYSLKNWIVEDLEFTFPFFEGLFKYTILYQDTKTKETFFCIVCVAESVQVS